MATWAGEGAGGIRAIPRGQQVRSRRIGPARRGVAARAPPDRRVDGPRQAGGKGVLPSEAEVTSHEEPFSYLVEARP